EIIHLEKSEVCATCTTAFKNEFNNSFKGFEKTNDTNNAYHVVFKIDSVKILSTSHDTSYLLLDDILKSIQNMHQKSANKTGNINSKKIRSYIFNCLSSFQ